MYNEDEELFTRSTHGVIKNVAHLCKRDRSKTLTWGKDGRKKVVVCIFSARRAKVNSRALSVIAAMGSYQEGVAKTKIGERAVTAHVYEYTTQVSVTPSLKIETSIRVSYPFRPLSVSKRKIKRRSTLTAGSSTLSAHVNIPSLEGVRYQLQRWRCMR